MGYDWTTGKYAKEKTIFGFAHEKPRNKREPTPGSFRNEVIETQNKKCKKCGNELDLRVTHIGHIRPVEKGGKTVLENLQALCLNCHGIKTHTERVKKTQKDRGKSKKSDTVYLFGNKINRRDIGGLF